MFLEVRKSYVVTIGGVVPILLVHKQNQSALIHGSTAQYSFEITSLKFLMQSWCVFLNGK